MDCARRRTRRRLLDGGSIPPISTIGWGELTGGAYLRVSRAPDAHPAPSFLSLSYSVHGLAFHSPPRISGLSITSCGIIDLVRRARHAAKDSMEETRAMAKPKDTIAYVIDENSPSIPSDALIVTSYGGGDAEEAWLREHFSGLWDDEEGRQFADALLQGLR